MAEFIFLLVCGSLNLVEKWCHIDNLLAHRHLPIEISFIFCGLVISIRLLLFLLLIPVSAV
jgi:hypothetical protein